MNKLLKGSIAGAAGVALLLGGAGTFALWNDSATIDGGQIVSGNLGVQDSGSEGVWTTAQNGEIDVDQFNVVPGDVLTFTKEMTVLATGDNLTAELGLSDASISASSADAPADVALAAYLTKSAQITATGTGISGSGRAYTVTAGPDGTAHTITVTVTIAFPKAAAAGAENGTMEGSVNLDALAVTLTQV